MITKTETKTENSSVNLNDSMHLNIMILIQIKKQKSLKVYIVYIYIFISISVTSEEKRIMRKNEDLEETSKKGSQHKKPSVVFAYLLLKKCSRVERIQALSVNVSGPPCPHL